MQLRAGNELWERSAFDSAALARLLQAIASDLLWLRLTASSLETSIASGLEEVNTLIRQHPDESDDFAAIFRAIDSMVDSAQKHIHTWRIGRAALDEKVAAVREQLERFISVASRDDTLGSETEVGLFYTEWMKYQLARGVSNRTGFWLPETETRFMLLREMDLIVLDLAQRWDAVSSLRVRAPLEAGYSGLSRRWFWFF
jgi:hypothetical protein